MDGTGNDHFSKVSQAHKDKGCMFSLICGRNIQKINKHKYMTISTYICIYNTFVMLGLLRELRRGKENDRVWIIQKYIASV
jgi:hypothetical protein